MGPHDLFTGAEESLVLSQVANAVAHHPGNVWLPIISLRREDAARLGYDNAENWRTLLSSYALEMAETMKIPWEQFRWYAAFHDEGHHPHVHMVCYSADPAKGFLTKDGIAKIKSDLAKRIFRQELTELYARQTQRRDTLTREAGAVMERLIRQMQTGALENARIEQLMAHLSHRLQFLSGKKQYHLGNIFREQTPPPSSDGMRAAVDRKLLRKIREKKMAQGHKKDDHEATMIL